MRRLAIVDASRLLVPCFSRLGQKEDGTWSTQQIQQAIACTTCWLRLGTLLPKLLLERGPERCHTLTILHRQLSGVIFVSAMHTLRHDGEARLPGLQRRGSALCVSSKCSKQGRGRETIELCFPTLIDSCYYAGFQAVTLEVVQEWNENKLLQQRWANPGRNFKFVLAGHPRCEQIELVSKKVKSEVAQLFASQNR